jgi:Protein of unknown function (DUF3592)
MISQIFIMLIMLIFPAIGIFIVIPSIQSLCLGMRSKKWPTTLAKVTHYEVNRYGGGDKSPIQYAYTNICVYEVQDMSYVNRDSWHGGFQTWSAAENAASKLCPVGQSLKIFYDPQKPVRSTLSPGWHWGSVWGIVFGILWLTFSCMPIIILFVSKILSQIAN